jgi:hypothetical protein
MVNNFRKVQFEYLEFLFKGMFSVKSKYYPDSTFFKRDDKVILELEKSGTLWVLYSVWTNISDMFSYDYGNTQQLIKEWVEAQLKKGKVEPFIPIESRFQRVESQLKQEEVTPSRASSMYGLRIAMVEEKLKTEEITPRSAIAPPFRWRKLDSVKYAEIKPTISTSYHLEEKLKSDEITPRLVVPGSFDWVQEQIIPKKIIKQI